MYLFYGEFYMLTISVSTENLLSQSVDCYAYIVEKNFDEKKLSEATKQCPGLANVIKHRGFNGSLQEVVSVPFTRDSKLAFCIVVGMGDQNIKGVGVVECYRRAVG